jgi:hypothetical protein
MRTVTALSTPDDASAFHHTDEQGLGQIPLPFPGMRPVLPAPIERGDARIVRERAARFMQALVEVLAGVRPIRQMAPWMAPDVYNQLTSRLSGQTTVPLGSRTGRGPRIVSVHVFMVNDEAAEIAGRMLHHGTSRAIAARLELQQTHRGEPVWRCTALAWA